MGVFCFVPSPGGSTNLPEPTYRKKQIQNLNKKRIKFLGVLFLYQYKAKDMSGIKERVKVFTNVYGEVMTMKLDSGGNFTILHTDCNDKFEPISKFVSEYVLMPEEVKQIAEFFRECKKDLTKS